jgi:8-oxo-dGTP diphosphatase
MPRQLSVAAGVLVDNSGRVLITRRPADTHMGGAWEFPGGKIADGETPLAGLLRELREELGIGVRYARHLARYRHDYPDRCVHLHVWLVPAWEGEPAGLEGQPLRWSEPERLLEEGLLPADAPVVNLLIGTGRVNTLAWQSLVTASRP